jgi:hypothetical protein
LRREFKASQTGLLEETQSKLAVTARACLEGFSREAMALADAYRSELRSMLKDSAVRSVAEFGADNTTLQLERYHATSNQGHSDSVEQQELRSKLLSANRLGASKGGWSLATTWVTTITSFVVFMLVSIFVILSIQPVMQLRLDPPAEFLAQNPAWSSKRRAAEERLARAYWESSVQGMQSKYAFGAELPNDPPIEFTVEGNGLKGETLKTDSESRNRYWRKFCQVWVLPQVWHKSYVWNTNWAR